MCIQPCAAGLKLNNGQCSNGQLMPKAHDNYSRRTCRVEEPHRAGGDAARREPQVAAKCSGTVPIVPHLPI